MIGLDTNVILRYLLQDDPAQSAKATRIMERLTEDDPGFVSLVAMTEAIWALDRIYGFSTIQIAVAVEHLLQAETLSIQNQDEVYAATASVRTGQGSFHDALIGLIGRWTGCDITLTFDKKASRLAGLKLID